MRALKFITWPLESRYLAFTAAILLTAASVAGAVLAPQLWGLFAILAAVFGVLALVGLHDIVQTRHSILRNYPIIGHLRFIFEAIRPEMRQYFFEDDKDGRPFARDKRTIVYQRAKKVLDKRPFGTVYDVYEPPYEWLNHSMAPVHNDRESFRLQIGGLNCAQPYRSSVLNVSGMSFGAISPNAIRAMNKGAMMGGFAQVTGEGAISRYHREHGGDLIWQLGSGYFGARDADGRFNPELFAETAADAQVKMIELKLSQGAKPGHGGVLPQAKITKEIAQTRKIPRDRDCVSPAAHPEFSSPIGMLEFVARLRELSAGKPVGIKFCVGHRWQVMALCKAMLETGITPDYIMIDGAEGGTGAAPLEFADHVGVPLREGLSYVHNALIGCALRDKIALGASGKVASAFDMVRVMALGADFCHAARAFMFAVGCIQAQSCHTGQCPTGVATTDPIRQRALVVRDKAKRVQNYHRLTVDALAEVLGSAGLSHPSQLSSRHVWRRVGLEMARNFFELYPHLSAGELLTAPTESHPRFAQPWSRAQAASFEPADGATA
ncbi:MAG: FMN-binding glutamate synthase family protein [Neomegalonema sp.]|nr:FMN-binding glutamate synthase family protein [Neomegalonema sp.]